MTLSTLIDVQRSLNVARYNYSQARAKLSLANRTGDRAWRRAALREVNKARHTLLNTMIDTNIVLDRQDTMD